VALLISEYYYKHVFINIMTYIFVYFLLVLASDVVSFSYSLNWSRNGQL
jgi:hypothetical protein